jgi:hypothetical protein
MAEKVKIRISLAFRNMAHATLLAFAMAILKLLTGNANFPNPTVDLAVLSAAIASYSAAIAESLDGSRRAISERNRQREVVISLLRQLAIYVEAVCNGNPAAFASSGFVAATGVRVMAQPLSQGIRKIDQGLTGQLTVRLVVNPEAYSYEVRYATVSDGTVGQWTTRALSGAKSETFPGLTPGTTYAFQVRPLLKSGFGDWSDSVTRMCT